MGELAEKFFDAEQIERARTYHRALYLAFALNAAVTLALLTWLSFGWLGDTLYELTDGWSWWARCLAFASLTIAIVSLARTPIAFAFGHVRERRWGFSTQSVSAWLGDRLKGVAIGLVLTAPLMLGLVWLARAFPELWPVPATAGAALTVLLVVFVAPVVIEPRFNRFQPLADEELAADLRALAEDAGAPVRHVLVADASRRTRKVNAYVSGFGRTRRVVLFDTLLERSSPRETKLVVAHELGHRRARHVLKLTAIGMAGAAAFVVVLWGLLQWDALLGAIGATGPGDPRVIPFVLLLAVAVEYVGLPLGSTLSRRFERQADRFSLELTGDADAYEATHRDLALANLSDLDPPRPAYVALHSHPTAPERIALGRRWAASTRSLPGPEGDAHSPVAY